MASLVLLDPYLLHLIASFFWRRRCDRHLRCEINERRHQNKKKKCIHHVQCIPLDWVELYNGDSAASAGLLSAIVQFQSRMSFTAQAMNNAMKQGHLEIVIWLHKNRTEGFSSDGMKDAARFGKLNILEWIHNSIENEFHSHWWPMISPIAALNGHFDIVKWIWEHRPDDFDELTIQEAAGGGHFEIVKWIEENTKNPKFQFIIDKLPLSRKFNEIVGFLQKYKIYGFTEQAFDNAALQGDLDTLKWLYNNNTDQISCTDIKFEYVAQSGNIEVVKWLDQIDCEFDVTDEVIEIAVKNNHLDFIKYLCEIDSCYHALVPKCATDEGKTEILEYMMEQRSCFQFRNIIYEETSLSALKWMHKNKPHLFQSPNGSQLGSTMDKLSQYGLLDCLIWMHHNRTEGCTTYAMDHAGLHSQHPADTLEIIEWLHHNRTEGCTIKAMDTAARRGDLSTLKFLHKNRTEGCSSHAMDGAAENGHLLILAWLHHNRTEGCTINALHMATANEHLKVVEWLTKNRPEDERKKEEKKPEKSKVGLFVVVEK
jgi:hypothetical protein